MALVNLARKPKRLIVNMSENCQHQLSMTSTPFSLQNVSLFRGPAKITWCTRHLASKPKIITGQF